MEKAAQRNREKQKREYESNAEVQRWRGMTKEQQVREAKSIMTKKVREYNDFKAGRDTTQAEAERKVDELTKRMCGTDA